MESGEVRLDNFAKQLVKIFSTVSPHSENPIFTTHWTTKIILSHGDYYSGDASHGSVVTAELNFAFKVEIRILCRKNILYPQSCSTLSTKCIYK